MTDKKTYCGINKLKKNQKRGDIRDCIRAKQVRFYGINKIDPKLLTFLTEQKQEVLDLDKLFLQLITLRGRVKGLTKKKENSKDEKEKKKFDDEILKTKNEISIINAKIKKLENKQDNEQEIIKEVVKQEIKEQKKDLKDLQQIEKQVVKIFKPTLTKTQINDILKNVEKETQQTTFRKGKLANQYKKLLAEKRDYKKPVSKNELNRVSQNIIKLEEQLENLNNELVEKEAEKEMSRRGSIKYDDLKDSIKEIEDEMYILEQKIKQAIRQQNRLEKGGCFNKSNCPCAGGISKKKNNSKVIGDKVTNPEIKKLLNKIPLDYLIVGSIIQEKSNPSDIDIITLKPLKEVENYFSKHYNIKDAYGKDKQLFFKLLLPNKKYVDINIWNSTESQLPYMLFAYSYPPSFNLHIRKKAKTLGLKLSQYGFYDKNNKLIDVKTFRDFFKILDIPFRTPEEQFIRETKYKNIKDGKKALDLIRKELKGGIDFLYPVKKGFQILANQYRKRFCNGKARPLEYGEFHVLCGNYEGPGTRIDLYPNYPPYNDADACAQQHDLSYSNAKGNPQLIRKADDEIIECLNKVLDNEPYKSLGLAGIESKMKLENLLPTLSKLISGKSYFGQE